MFARVLSWHDVWARILERQEDIRCLGKFSTWNFQHPLLSTFIDLKIVAYFFEYNKVSGHDYFIWGSQHGRPVCPTIYHCSWDPEFSR
jgi:hypothetical protein